MKKILVLMSLLLAVACSSEKMDIAKAKLSVEALLQKIDNSDFKGTSDYYAPEFNDGESLTARAEKFRQMEEKMGKMKSFEMISSRDDSKAGEDPILMLVYKVKREKINSIETFTLTKDEGEYKIAAHLIKSEGL